MHTMYGQCKEEVPADTTHYVDANLMHNLVTGRWVIGLIHFFSQTPIDTYTKNLGHVQRKSSNLELNYCAIMESQFKNRAMIQ
jgi:hypothetical protein